MKLLEDHKLVIVVDQDLPIGLIANTACVLSLSIGEKLEGLIGENIPDIQGNIHAGITTTPIPILKSDKMRIKEIRDSLFVSDVFVVDFCSAAQTTKNYEDYSKKILSQEPEYLGVAMVGPKKQVNKLTGNLPLLR